MFGHILVPSDFSEAADAALDYARILAQKFGATLQLLHVIELAHAPGAFSGEVFIAETPDTYDLLRREAHLKLAKRVRPADLARHGATTEVITGQSAGVIVQYATDMNIDLIVMGTHGRTGLAHLLMGSVAEHVVRTAPCPVLTVRHARVWNEVPVSLTTALAAG